MKYKISSDKDTVNFIQQALRDNDGYCPSHSEERGNPDYRAGIPSLLFALNRPEYRGSEPQQ